MIGDGDSAVENGPFACFLVTLVIHSCLIAFDLSSTWSLEFICFSVAGFDNLSSTIAAAEAVGFKTVAWATIESCADEAHRRLLTMTKPHLS